MFNEGKGAPDSSDALAGMAKLVGLPAGTPEREIKVNFRRWENGMDTNMRRIGTSFRESLGLDDKASEEEVYTAFMALNAKSDKKNDNIGYGGISAGRN